MLLAAGAGRCGEADGDTLRQVALEINSRVDVVRCVVVDRELDGQQPGDIHVPDGRHHLVTGGEVPGRRGGVRGRRGVDGVDVDAHMAAADVVVRQVAKGVELDGDDGAVAGAVGVGREEAEHAPGAVGRDT